MKVCSTGSSCGSGGSGEIIVASGQGDLGGHTSIRGSNLELVAGEATGGLGGAVDLHAGGGRKGGEIIIKAGRDDMELGGSVIVESGTSTGDVGGQVAITTASGKASGDVSICLLYTSPSPRDATLSRMPSSA